MEHAEFDPAEIRRMMQMRQRELRGKHAAPGEPFESPTKRSRGEKENTMSPAKSGEGPSSPHKVQGFMAKFAVSPKNPRKNMAAVETNNPNTASSSKTRFSELSKRYAEMEDELPAKKSSTPTQSTSTTPKRQAPLPPTSASASSAASGKSGCFSRDHTVATATTAAGCSIDTRTKKRAPSPPTGKSKARNRAPSPPPQSTQKRWEVVERTTVTIRTAEESVNMSKKQPGSENRLDDSVSTMTFAKAKAVAKAREEAAGLIKSPNCASAKIVPDPSEAKVADKVKNFKKVAEKESVSGTAGERQQVIPKSRVVPRGKIAEKVSRFDVDSSGPRCVIETKPLGSVSSRAKFFERAMEEDRKAADAAYVPVNQRIAKEIEKDTCSNQARAIKLAVCSTQLSPTEKPLVTPQPGSSQQLQLKPCKTDDAAAAAPSVDDNAGNDDHEGTEDFDKFEDRGKSVDEGESIEDERTTIADDHQVKIMQPLLPLSPKAQNPLEKDVPKKIGQVSNKLKNRLEDMIVHGHQTPDETYLSVTERTELRQEQSDIVEEEGERDDLGRRGETFIDDSILTPRLPRKSEHLIDDDTISRLTGIPEDGHSTPLGKVPPSSEESLATPVTKTMSQYRRDEKQAAEQHEENVKRIVYQIPSNMMQEIRKGKDVPIEGESNSSLGEYKRQIEEEIVKQESIMKQTSHALAVCQDNGDRGSEQHVEAERLLLISTQRHQAAQSELQRLNVQNSIPQPGGTLTICDITLPFKKEFLKLLRSSNDLLTSTHYFMVLVRSGASLLHTEVVSTNEKIHGGAVNLTHHMVLKNLQEGFRVFIDVYAVEAPNREHPDYEMTMKKLRREKEKEQNAHKGGILSAFTPNKRKTPSTPGNAGSSYESVKIRRPSFGLIGRVTLDESLILVNKEVHYLDNYYSESPLDGRIVMKIQLNMPPKVTHCGMLRLKDSSGMFGTTDFIKSFFAAIEGSRLNLWNDMREAEEEQEPLRSFDLAQVAHTVRVQQSFNFFYFPIRLNNGLELLFLTYSEAESSAWTGKLNACIASVKSRKY
ncbi:uncharacterized protein LOC111271987 [Varroa jacobsoni]|uniref:uncharacterized protein LOC111271987 n=1 Tax=Varroa jacobsoni TaxID=62625 RepID=UPI000BF59B13|nr:uncharacterized protein LOC111271987 [Varroa jacobsoni]